MPEDEPIIPREDCQYPYCSTNYCMLRWYVENPVTDEEMLDALESFECCPDYERIGFEFEKEIAEALGRVYPDYTFDE